MHFTSLLSFAHLLGRSITWVVLLSLTSLVGILAGPIGIAASDQPVIGATSSMVNVFPDQPPAAGELAGRLKMAAARRERTSAQVVVVARGAPVHIDAVEVEDLRDSRGRRLSARSVMRVDLVGYARIEQNSWRGVKRPGLWPDPLLPFRPFECPPAEARSLWLTAHVPESAPAGTFNSMVTLRAGGQRVAQIPLVLRVFGFSLPDAPLMHTSYWTNLESRYPPEKEPRALDQMIAIFGEYRTSTNLWVAGLVKWYREADGSITCDASGMQRTLERAVAAGFSTLQVGSGCWATSSFDAGVVVDRASREVIPKTERERIPGTTLAKSYLNPLCDWLQKRGWLDRAYMQIYDECSDPATWPSIVSFYATYRKLEPRLKLLGLTGIHPATQGAYDLWSPHTAFYDAGTYDMVRNGVSLYGRKNFKASVTASSTGGWGNEAFYRYQPVDAYDGCEYTKWVPKQPATVDSPQWLQFNMEAPEEIDGIRIVPYGEAPPMTDWRVEASQDGQEFQPLDLAKRENSERTTGSSFGFRPGRYKTFRIVWSKLDKNFQPSERQPLPPPESCGAGVREVEFLRRGLVPESTAKRGRTRPAEMWEYNVGADYPSVCIDADPAEIRSIGWRSWERGLVGYLNWGGGHWGFEGPGVNRSTGEDPLVWFLPANGSAMITYPGKDRVLPSVRLARFRDGLEDYDYLRMLQARRPSHPLLARLRHAGQGAYHSAASIQACRLELAKTLEAKR